MSKWVNDYRRSLASDKEDNGTWRTINVPSLDGVMAGSLSTSSWTIMVFTDSVSPLLKFRDDLRRQNPELKNSTPTSEHILLKVIT